MKYSEIDLLWGVRKGGVDNGCQVFSFRRYIYSVLFTKREEIKEERIWGKLLISYLDVRFEDLRATPE